MTTILVSTIDTNLKIVERTLRRVVASAVLKGDEDALTELATVKEALSSLSEHARRELPKCAERKSLMTGLDLMHNNTASIIDLALEGELEEAALSEYLDKNRRRIFKVNTLISSLRKLQGESVVKQKADIAIATRSTRGEDNPEHRSDALIQEYQHYRSLLPRSASEVKKPFMIARIPIYVKTKPFVAASSFASTGVTAKEFKGGYSVVENQLVIGINVNKLKEEKKKPEEFREAIVKIISAQYKTRFVVMSKFNMPVSNTGMVFTWLMKESEHNAVIRANGGRTFSVVEWTPAFK